MGKPARAENGCDPSTRQHRVLAKDSGIGGDVRVEVGDACAVDLDATSSWRRQRGYELPPEAPLGKYGLADRQIPLGRYADAPRHVAGGVPGRHRLEVHVQGLD